MQGYDIFDLGGFEFNACVHNVKKGAFSSKQATKTGTTICGVIYSNGVVLGADTRSTNGETVADKNCEKIHYIAPNIYCCGAGTAADTEAVTGMHFIHFSMSHLFLILKEWYLLHSSFIVNQHFGRVVLYLRKVS